MPCDDRRGSLAAALEPTGVAAVFVLQGTGSLSVARLHTAGAAHATELRGEPDAGTVCDELVILPAN